MEHCSHTILQCAGWVSYNYRYLSRCAFARKPKPFMCEHHTLTNTKTISFLRRREVDKSPSSLSKKTKNKKKNKMETPIREGINADRFLANDCVVNMYAKIRSDHELSGVQVPTICCIAELPGAGTITLCWILALGVSLKKSLPTSFALKWCINSLISVKVINSTFFSVDQVCCGSAFNVLTTKLSE